ncbi:hypothetical protein D8L93_11000 [Sodalis-like symbiont of Bactericera trigonica]|nr:hypothetical protein D8L93_11000 [Sodalis-like symbiont of Bactericera trigonica]
MASGVTSALFPFVVGAVLDHFNLLGKIGLGYNLLFILCGITYIAAWLCMRFIYPSQDKVSLAQTAVQNAHTTKGWVLGGSLEMMLVADIRVAGQSAKFGAPEVVSGLWGMVRRCVYC